MDILINVVKREISPGRSIDTVNARELWVLLEVAKDFSSWVKAQVDRAKLKVGKHFVTALTAPPKGGPEYLEYFLSTEAAKHVCMVSGTDKAFEVRDYFIERDNELAALHAAGTIALDLNSPASCLQALTVFAQNLVDEQAKVARLEVVVSETAPKAEAFDELATNTNGSFCMRLACKHFAIPERKFTLRLNQMGWIFKPHGSNSWHSYSECMKQGYMEHRLHPYRNTQDEPCMATQARVTAAGMAKLALIFSQERKSSVSEANPVPATAQAAKQHAG